MLPGNSTFYGSRVGINRADSFVSLAGSCQRSPASCVSSADRRTWSHVTFGYYAAVFQMSPFDIVTRWQQRTREINRDDEFHLVISSTSSFFFFFFFFFFFCFIFLLYYFDPGSDAKYYLSMSVCLFVCLSVGSHISKQPHVQICCACCFCVLFQVLQ